MENQDTEQENRSLLYLAADNNTTTDTFVSALHQYGYEIKSFHQAVDLAKAIAEQEPNVLILDCDADQGQLAAAAMKARATADEAFFPVIMLSSEDDFEKRLEAVRADVDGYFIKPVDTAALSDRIDDKISRRKIRAYHILAVDDDVLLSEFYQAVLSLAAMQVKVLNDPTQILEALHNFKPDLILMDMYMPSCTGAEIAKLIRQNNTYVNIPLIFLSGDGDIDRQVSAIETGADNFLTKPIDPENLISIISSRVERYRALRQGSNTYGLFAPSN
ncbi:MAG TPA: response regulator [Burkholderiaceae bacterium]|jgi:DNA-binding response OmpR family regulator